MLDYLLDILNACMDTGGVLLQTWKLFPYYSWFSSEI